MSKLLLALIIAISFISCKKEETSTKNFLLTGNIKGLKEGKLYIQRIKDTLLMPIDSIYFKKSSLSKILFASVNKLLFFAVITIPE